MRSLVTTVLGLATGYLFGEAVRAATAEGSAWWGVASASCLVSLVLWVFSYPRGRSC